MHAPAGRAPSVTPLLAQGLGRRRLRAEPECGAATRDAGDSAPVRQGVAGRDRPDTLIAGPCVELPPGLQLCDASVLHRWFRRRQISPLLASTLPSTRLPPPSSPAARERYRMPLDRRARAAGPAPAWVTERARRWSARRCERWRGHSGSSESARTAQPGAAGRSRRTFGVIRYTRPPPGTSLVTLSIRRCTRIPS